MTLKTGILGLGHLGKIHLKCLNMVDQLDLAGVYDPKQERLQFAVDQYEALAFSSSSELIDAMDAVVIVTPTPTHFQLAHEAISKGKHVFIEKPVCQDPEKARQLLELCESKDVVVQVGHVERFNPAFLAVREKKIRPMFVEVHRLASFNPRGTDVSVVLDLMIHDLDIVLSMVDAPVVDVRANGVAVVSDSPDIANVRIEFANGCVANLTASRMSFKKMRKMRIFQHDAYISMDFLEKQTSMVRLYHENSDDKPSDVPLMELQAGTAKKWVQIEQLDSPPVNAIQQELHSFAESILNNTKPKVSLQDGYAALQLASRILEEIEKQKIKLP